MRVLVLTFALSFSPLLLAGMGQGIYVSQATLENAPKLEQLIREALEAKIDTFVIDIARPSSFYAEQIAKVKEANIKYVARVVMFPGGGTAEQIKSKAHWEAKYRLVSAALAYGADAIQLDYIRYSSKNRRSAQNARDIYEVIKWFNSKLSPLGIPLQIDVFGIALLGESPYIGQNVRLFADAVDVICPMTYPSHYEPYLEHSKAPYEAVRGLLEAMKRQFPGPLPFVLNPFIEVSNYRFPMSSVQKQAYILAQIDAARDAGAQGWYAWSAKNKYDDLFKVLTKYPDRFVDFSAARD